MADYVVDGARLKCDRGEAASALSIPAARMCLGGKPAAGRSDCISDFNIFSFGECSSGTYFCSRKAKQGATHPCVLDLMDHYFLTDEKAVISDLAEMIVPLENCKLQIRKILNFTVNEMTGIQHQFNKKMNYPLSDIITKQYGMIWKKTENIYNLREAAEEISQAVILFTEAAQQNCNYLRTEVEDMSICLRLDHISEQLNLLVNQSEVLSDLPEMEENQLVTTESFLICRCGGIITFDSSGQ